MSAFEEFLDSGRFGPLAVSLLLNLLKQTARRKGYPPPEGHSDWTDDACNEALQKVFEIRPAFQTRLYEQAYSQESFERLARKIIDSALIDMDRATPAGRMVRRLRNVLVGEPRIERLQPPQHARGWALDGGPYARTARSRDDLLRAAHRVPGSVSALNPAGPTPRATKDRMQEVGVAVLTAAAGSVSETDMAVIVLDRFHLWSEPRSVPSTSTSEEWDLGEAAAILWETLDDEQRAVLACSEGTLGPYRATYESLGVREVEAIRGEIIAAAFAIAATEARTQQLIASLKATQSDVTPEDASSELETGIIKGEEES